MNNLELLQVYSFDKKVRYGSNNDGGYVIAELDGGDKWKAEFGSLENDTRFKNNI